MDLNCGQRKPLRSTVFGLLGDTCLYSWHSLYMDNFHNSLELSEKLLGVKVHTVGTLRSYRGEPADICNIKVGKSKMKVENFLSMDIGKIMVGAWKDKRVVTALSTKHDGSICVITRKKEERPQ